MSPFYIKVHKLIFVNADIELANYTLHYQPLYARNINLCTLFDVSHILTKEINLHHVVLSFIKLQINAELFV